MNDQQAIDRYRYLLQTAPPEAIEQVHAEAFAQLTPDQRRQVLASLGDQLPEHERRAATDDPRGLARMATRAEMREPGILERTFGGMGAGGGPSFGSMFASSLLGSIAGYVIGSAIADQFFSEDSSDPGLDPDASAWDSGGFDFTEV